MERSSITLKRIFLFTGFIGLFLVLANWTSLTASADIYAGTSNPGVVYKYAGATEWDPISPTEELPPEDIVAEFINIENPHPYPNNYNNTWTLIRSGAVVMRIHFSYIRTESGYDYVYIKDGDGNIINTYSGDYTDIWTDWVFDDTLQIQLVSDGSVIDDGFVADQLEWSTEQPQAPLGWAVLSLVEYGGHLYAGTMSTSGYDSIGQVYRYDGENTWTLVGDNMDNQVSMLVVFNGDLYAGTSGDRARLYRYNSINEEWDLVVDYPYWSGFRSGYVWERDGFLYLGDYGYDKIGRYDGTNFEPLVDLGGSCIWDFESYGDYLYASAWHGDLHRSDNGTDWVHAVYHNPDDRNIWAIKNYQGYLYMGMDWRGYGDQEGQLWRFNGSSVEYVWGEPVDYYEEGILALEIWNGELFIGMGAEVGYYHNTQGTGKIFKYDGTSVISVSDVLGQGVQVLYAPPVVSKPDLTLSPQDISFHNISIENEPLSRANEVIIAAEIHNIGSVTATNVQVRFSDATTGEEIGTKTLSAIGGNDSAYADCMWELSTDVQNHEIKIEITGTDEEESNVENNEASRIVSIYYVDGTPFDLKVDAYSFENWALGDQGVRESIADLLTPIPLPSLRKLYYLPLMFFSPLAEKGGHCWGMASTSILYRDNPSLKPVDQETYQMQKDNLLVVSKIKEYQRAVFPRALEIHNQLKAGTNNPANEYNTILSYLSSSEQPIMLVMESPKEEGHEEAEHAVVAYKIIDTGDLKKVYI